MTQRTVAEVLGCGQAKINKIESTLAEIDPAELDSMLDHYRVPASKADELRDLAEQCRRRRRAGPPPMSPEFAYLSDVEQNATQLLSLHSERIPGPLQSEFYMLRQFWSQPLTTPDVVELVERRQARTALFTIDDPPRYRVILSESSFLRMPGGRQPDLEVDQIEHLLNLISAHARLEVQLLPFVAPSSFVGADFVIAQFDGEIPDFAYVEYPGGGTLVKARKNLAALVEHWHELHEVALNRDESVKFLYQLAADARRRWQEADEG